MSKLPTLSIEMDNSLRDKRTRSYVRVRSIMHFTMGLLYLTGAAFLFFPQKFGTSLENFDTNFRYIFGGLCAIYGGWRIYRGLQKAVY